MNIDWVWEVGKMQKLKKMGVVGYGCRLSPKSVISYCYCSTIFTIRFLVYRNHYLNHSYTFMLIKLISSQ